MRLAVLLPLAFAACTPTAEPVAPRMSFDAAERLCEQRASQYARTPRAVPGEGGTIQIGLRAELPDSFMVRDFYRSCVYANSGVRPRTMPDIPIFG